MPINFGLLGNQSVSHNIQPLKSSGSSGDSDSGIGSLFDGLKGLAGAINQAHSHSQTGYTGSGTGQNTLSSLLGQQQPTGLQGALQQGTNLGNNSSNSVFENASKELGLDSKNPTLQSYLQKANPSLDPTQTPWCAGFVGSVLDASGLKGTGSLAAKSYLNYGQATNSPSKGDIVVFNDLTGQNRSEHGHVGFVQGIDSKSGTVTVLGGNQSGKVSTQSYPLSMVAGFRQAPSGQEVKQFAQQNNIQTPQQLSQLPSQMQKQQTDNSSLDQSKGLLRQFEGFQSKPTYDVNAYRTGYGSDTITKADGTIQKVQPGINVSKEDAERDLDRRTQAFQHTASLQVGDNWNKLPANAQAALTSVAYNYGSLPPDITKAAKTGDLNQISDAIRSRAGDNKGVNKDRRNKEADYLLNGTQNKSQKVSLLDNPPGTGVINPLNAPQPIKTAPPYAPGLPPLRTAQAAPEQQIVQTGKFGQNNIPKISWKNGINWSNLNLFKDSDKA